MAYSNSKHKQRQKKGEKREKAVLHVKSITLISLTLLIGLIFAVYPISSSWLRTATILTSALWAIYLVFYKIALRRGEKRREEAKGDFGKLRGLKNLEKVWTSGVRETSMITMGSLFVPTAFLLLGVAAQHDIPCSAKIALSIWAPLLYLIWLFTVQLSTRVMTDVEGVLKRKVGGSFGAYERLQNKLYGAGHGKGPLIWTRRNHWLFYIPLLVYGSTFVMQGTMLNVGCFP